MYHRKLAKVWRDLGMVDDPEKEISEFFDVTHRQATGAQQYITLVRKAYESFGENLQARLIAKKQDELDAALDHLDHLGDFFVEKAQQLDDLSDMHNTRPSRGRRQYTARTKRPQVSQRTTTAQKLAKMGHTNPHLRPHLRPVLKAIQKQAASQKLDYTNQDILDFIQQNGSITVWELVYAFGGTPSSHTARLQQMVKDGTLVYNRGDYDLA